MSVPAISVADIPVVFENEHFLAVDKPAGWLTVPSRFGEKDERPCLGIELQKIRGRLWPVHRLDVEVSGLVLFARDAEAHRAASKWFEGRSVRKLYSALTEGVAGEGSLPEGAEAPSWRSGIVFRWESRLLRGKKRAYEHAAGKVAVTKAVWLGTRSEDGFQTWELEPLTGRSHQLRYELSKRGYPIVGDRLYGAIKDFSTIGGIALRSVLLSVDPRDGEAFGLPTSIRVDGLFDGPIP